MAWFRWELPPLQGYYLMEYWESSKGASSAGNVIEIQWLYKAASGRKSVPAISEDVAFNGFGLSPVQLSFSARQDGWTQLVKLPAQRWASPELETFFQRDFYDGRTFSQVIAQPMLLASIVPFLFLVGVIYLRRDIKDEWKRFYAGPFGDDLIVNLPALKQRLAAFFIWWKEGRSAQLDVAPFNPESIAKQTPTKRADETRSKPIERHPFKAANQAIEEASSRKPMPRSIFPGARAFERSGKTHRVWDESQWIE
ncbi:hypothetical protein [Terriglobus roseus]|uniref:hypothetical protein n=1 Tax=Terriglobus roseus TaxID=392734 RepID=UPI0015602A9D|nr:hypothetical protein [Terriglobus roseus]